MTPKPTYGRSFVLLVNLEFEKSVSTAHRREENVPNYQTYTRTRDAANVVVLRFRDPLLCRVMLQTERCCDRTGREKRFWLVTFCSIWFDSFSLISLPSSFSLLYKATITLIHAVSIHNDDD